MNEPIIRHAEPSDYQPIIAVVNDWWAGRQMSDMLPKLFFVHFQTTSFVAEQDGKIVGFVTGFVSQTFPEEAYIHFVGVNPMSRKSGLARVLYERFFTTVQNLGCCTVRCVTSPVNKDSIAFHRSMGFSAETNVSEKTIDGISVFEGYDGQGEDRLLFYKALGGMENTQKWDRFPRH
jgi:predicted GNAT superfamily acetyltransferase